MHRRPAIPPTALVRATLVWAGLLCAGLLPSQTAAPGSKDEAFVPSPPPEQPLPFSHKLHVGLGAQCTDCHQIKDPGFLAGYPPTGTCMACHAAIKTESPHIQKLAELDKQGKQVPWVKVYKVPDYVYFSHDWHYNETKIRCQECHGPVAERDAIFQEKPVTMIACMSCHDRHKASTECNLCHDGQ